MGEALHVQGPEAEGVWIEQEVRVQLEMVLQQPDEAKEGLRG